MVVTDGLHRITGDLDPDRTGDYLPLEIYNGKMSYQRLDGANHLWWDPPDAWIISDTLGWPSAPFWTRVDPDIEGTYNPNPPATGIATVTEF